MSTEEIDRIIERYAEERRREPQKVAQQHFLAYAYLVCKSDEFEQFMKRTRGLAAYYIDSLSLFNNPFKNTQVCWLLLIFLLFGLSIYMITDDNLYIAGIFICTWTVVFGTTLWKIVWSKWLDTSVMIACYKEIIALIDSMQLSRKTDAA